LKNKERGRMPGREQPECHIRTRSAVAPEGAFPKAKLGLLWQAVAPVAWAGFQAAGRGAVILVRVATPGPEEIYEFGVALYLADNSALLAEYGGWPDDESADLVRRRYNPLEEVVCVFGDAPDFTFLRVRGSEVGLPNPPDIRPGHSMRAQ
jgi:hypothetical protein